MVGVGDALMDGWSWWTLNAASRYGAACIERGSERIVRFSSAIFRCVFIDSVDIAFSLSLVFSSPFSFSSELQGKARNRPC